MSTAIWTVRDFEAFLARTPPPHTEGFYAMYGSPWDAIVTDPACMCVPVDDHLVHRGDGVFETLLCEEGAVYNLGAHVERLRSSAEAIGLACPWSDAGLREVVVDTFSAAGKERALGRLLLGRGPGGFSVDPNESTGTSLYLVVYRAPAPFMEREPEGAKVMLSAVPPKSGGLARVKTCNYLPNAMVKAEAVKAGAHFALGVDGEGFLTESFTENLAVVDREGALVIPPPVHHLPGTTLRRVAELAEASGRAVREEKLRPEELFRVSEVWVVGTTAYVTRVCSVDGRAVSTGPMAGALAEALREDIRSNPEMRTLLRG